MLNFLYRLFLMSYFERQKYFNELVDSVYQNDIPKIVKKLYGDSK